MDVFNKTIITGIPLMLVGYEMIIANSHPMRTHRIHVIVKCHAIIDQALRLRYVMNSFRLFYVLVDTVI